MRMIPHRLLRCAAVCGLALLAACGPKEATADAPPENAAKGPAMWLVSDADSKIYLFGTFHILPANVGWQTPAFVAAMEQTPVTITEVDAKSPAAQAELSRLVAELGYNARGQTLSALLGPTRAVRFAAIVERYGLSMTAFEPMKPWLAMITLSVAIMQKEGFAADSGAEEAILARAENEHDRIEHLESAEYQIRALASLDEAEILADFDASLEEYEDFDDYARLMVSAWAAGDVGTLEKETLTDLRRKAPGAFRILIKDRNENWTRKIAEILDGDEDCFIAVGAGHLVGADSVVDMLEKKGFAVERVQ